MKLDQEDQGWVFSHLIFLTNQPLIQYFKLVDLI